MRYPPEEEPAEEEPAEEDPAAEEEGENPLICKHIHNNTHKKSGNELFSR